MTRTETAPGTTAGPIARRLGATLAGSLIAVAGLAACSSAQSPGPQSSSSASPSSPAPSGPAPSSPAPSSPAASGPATGGSAAPTSVRLTIKDYAYSPLPTVAPGTRITITNRDSEAHTVTADSGDVFDVSIAPGASATLTAPATGTYHFHCTYHANMHGTLQVG